MMWIRWIRNTGIVSTMTNFFNLNTGTVGFSTKGQRTKWWNIPIPTFHPQTTSACHPRTIESISTCLPSPHNRGYIYPCLTFTGKHLLVYPCVPSSSNKMRYISTLTYQNMCLPLLVILTYKKLQLLPVRYPCLSSSLISEHTVYLSLFIIPTQWNKYRTL
jgi:hypothetical protein